MLLARLTSLFPKSAVGQVLFNAPRCCISTTAALFAEPMKKKKKTDISLTRMKQERRAKKIEKEIKKMRKTPKQLKPVDEYVLAPQIMKELKARQRKPTEADAVVKDSVDKFSIIWVEYTNQQATLEYRALRRVQQAQAKALEHLKLESRELHRAALEIDELLLPFEDNLIIKDTPPNKNYVRPDGKKSDITKAWSM